MPKMKDQTLESGKGSKSKKEKMHLKVRKKKGESSKTGVTGKGTGNKKVDSTSGGKGKGTGKGRGTELILHIGSNQIPPLACGICKDRFYLPRSLMVNIENAHGEKESSGRKLKTANM